MQQTRTKIYLLSTLMFFVFTSFLREKEKELNYVPNKEIAEKIAEAIWLPIYGESVLSEKPYHAELTYPAGLNVGVWVVMGTLKTEVGGVAYIEIQKSDCKILKVTHGK